MTSLKKEQHSIPANKVSRAAKFVGTGAKVGRNYLKHYVSKAFNMDVSKEDLHEQNAKDIYDSLSELKGSALKMAQMLSMDKNLLPEAFTRQFAFAQNSAPPLSYPLIRKTFIRHLEKSPEELFDTFTTSAVNAASIGQVHKATLNGKEFAVKIQYPGVADSIKSDLTIAKPFALKLMNVSARDIDPYMDEIEGKLLEETDYLLELERSVEITEACSSLEGIYFPEYFRDFSCKRILTMSWLEGSALKDWLASGPSQDARDLIGNRLWQFYDFQIHRLNKVHADPHPGNFLVNKKNELGILDFGCVKEIPEEFYRNYFELLDPAVFRNTTELTRALTQLDVIREGDEPEMVEMILNTFTSLFELVSRPFHSDSFDFGDESFFNEIISLGERLSKDPRLKNLSARGSKHFIYINRTYFGLYNILHLIGAKVETAVRV
jgi:predicted unusual protein kinase regulating ubiquinone biosynthesis (AarF/ABC1/UbiB family)